MDKKKYEPYNEGGVIVHRSAPKCDKFFLGLFPEYSDRKKIPSSFQKRILSILWLIPCEIKQGSNDFIKTEWMEVTKK